MFDILYCFKVVVVLTITDVTGILYPSNGPNMLMQMDDKGKYALGTVVIVLPTLTDLTMLKH